MGAVVLLATRNSLLRMIKIAILAPSPAVEFLPLDRIKSKYRNREHASSWVRSLSGALAARSDCRVEVFVHSRAVAQRASTENHGVRFHFVPKYEPIRTDPFHGFRPGMWRLMQPLRNFEPDLVHAFGLETGYGQIAAQLPWPRIVFIQGIVELYRPWREIGRIKQWCLERQECRALRRMDAAVVETEFARRWVGRTAPNVHTKLIPHAFRPEFLEVEADYLSRTAIWIGRMDRRKAPQKALEAMLMIDDETTRLIMVGDGPERSSCEAWCRAYRLTDRVEFTGALPHRAVLEQMARASFMVLTSRMDVSPNVLTEAHAAGLPVAATAAGGIPEMIEVGRDGRLVPVDDARGMAEVMRAWFRSSGVCETMGRNGREKVKTLHAPNAIAAAHMDLYNQIIGVQKT